MGQNSWLPLVCTNAADFRRAPTADSLSYPFLCELLVERCGDRTVIL